MKSLLVHLDASPRAAERLSLAAQLARRHDAELTATYGVLSALLATPWAAEAPSAELTTALLEIDRTQQARARALFDRVVAAQGFRGARWTEPGADALVWQLVRQALTSDLLVLGQPDPQDRLAGAVPSDLVPSLVVDSGKPALVVPYAGTFEAAPESVLLAWKPSREAARATSAALPWLRQARRVHVATAPEDDESPALTELQHWLRLQGVHGEWREHRLDTADLGEMLLSLAADTGAGLLVMGCFGHSRTREWVLGGVTRSVLRAMTVPTLMAH